MPIEWFDAQAEKRHREIEEGLREYRGQPSYAPNSRPVDPAVGALWKALSTVALVVLAVMLVRGL